MSEIQANDLSKSEEIKDSQLILKIIDEIKKDIGDEEIIFFLLDKKQQAGKVSKGKITLGQKAADKVASFVGSWYFIGCFAVMLIFWITTNLVILTKPYDPYPFILLNLILSMIAAIQAPLVMMSQNRKEEKDRERSENDYRVNLKTEIIIEDLHQKMNELSKIQLEIHELQKNLYDFKQ